MVGGSIRLCTVFKICYNMDMTTKELVMVINQMTDDERSILSEYVDALIAKRKRQKVHTKAELLNRVRKVNKAITDGDELKSANVFLAEIREKYGVQA